MTIFYSTKYAMTKGIEQIDGEVNGINRNCVEYKIDNYTLYLWGEEKDWHRSLESATKRAEEMRLKKISSLEKLLDKFKKMSTVPVLKVESTSPLESHPQSDQPD